MQGQFATRLVFRQIASIPSTMSEVFYYLRIFRVCCTEKSLLRLLKYRTGPAAESCRIAVQGTLQAPFGIIGLETMLGLVLTELVDKKVLSLKQAIEKLTVNPSKILNLPYGKLDKNSVANITIFDLNKEWKVEPQKFYSKSINTPFTGYQLKGKSILTIINGKKITI